MNFLTGGTYRIEVREEGSDTLVWKRERVSGALLLKIAPMIQKAIEAATPVVEAAREAGQATGALSRAWGHLRKMGGGAMLAAALLQGCATHAAGDRTPGSRLTDRTPSPAAPSPSGVHCGCATPCSTCCTPQPCKVVETPTCPHAEK